MGFKSIFIFICLLYLGNKIQAQTFVRIRPKAKGQISSIEKLSIGDKVPNIYFKHLVNYKKGIASFNMLRGKRLTVLDFWSSSCSSCIDLFPHVQQLQDKFRNQIQVILVNGKSKLFNDDEAKIKAILLRVKKNTNKEITLPIVYNCEVLDNYLPFVKLPQEVWINDKGIIVAITGSEEVNSNNIKAVLQGQEINMHYKKDVHIDLGKQTLNELLYGSDRIKNTPLFTSTLIKGMIDGINSRGIRVTENGKIYGLFISNQPLLSLYQSAYRNIIDCPDNQILIQNSDTLLFKKVNFSGTAYYSQLYSYDLTAPPGEMNQYLLYMQSDLEKFFHILVTKEKRNLPCYIVKAPNLNSIHTIGGEATWETKNIVKYIRNYPVNQVLAELNKHFKIPLIDDTGLQINMDIKLPESLADMEAIIEALKNSGFEVEKANRELDVVIFGDKH